METTTEVTYETKSLESTLTVFKENVSRTSIASEEANDEWLKGYYKGLSQAYDLAVQFIEEARKEVK